MTSRKHRQRPWRSLAAGPFIVAVLALAAGTTADAAETTGTVDTGWELRFYAAAVDMDPGSKELAAPGSTSFGYDVSAGGGVGFNAEYRFSRRLGIDLGLFSGGNVEFDGRVSRAAGASRATYDTLTFTPLTAGLDVHLTPASRFDLYACPMVALVQYGRLSWYDEQRGWESTVDFDEDFALGARIGLGVPFGQKRWSFQANFTYLDSRLDGHAGGGVRIDRGYDTTLFGLGFGYTFRDRSP